MTTTSPSSSSEEDELDEAAHRLEVSAADEGERLDKYLAQHIPDSSRSQVQKHIDAGCVRVDGAPPKRGAATALLGGMIIEYTPPAPAPVELVAEDLPITVLFEDADVVVVDKPAGLVVHPAAGHWTGTLVNALMFRIPDFARGSSDLRPGIVHRLDRDTTGVMVVAKNEVAHRVLVEDFAARRVEKEYLAITHGVPTPARGAIDTLFGRHPTDRKRFSSKVRDGKRAITHYTVARAYGGGAARVDVRLETGRTHQIRVHFADAGHPLIGDATYGTRRLSHPREAKLRAITDAFARPALHARRLAIQHPRTRAPLAFEAAIPDDLVQLMAALEDLG